MAVDLSLAWSSWRQSLGDLLPLDWRQRYRSLHQKLIHRFDRTSRKARLTAAVILSLLFHLLCLALLLWTPAKGLISIGTTGEGHRDGAGTAIDLVQPVFTSATQANTLSTTDVIAIKQYADATPQSADIKLKDKVALNGLTSETLAEVMAAEDGKAQSKLSTPATASAGAKGQSGDAEDALWNAIAPCWYRLADADTLPAILKVTFTPTGGLAIPPEIERDPKAPITNEMLQSEAKAIAALAECGAYPMAQGKQGVEITFPRLQ